MSETLTLVCRCCLNVQKKNSSFQNFTEIEDESLTRTIGECFSQLTTIEIPEEELKESLICKKCFKDLKISHSFKQKCLENQEEFLKLICKNPKDPVEVKDELVLEEYNFEDSHLIKDPVIETPPNPEVQEVHEEENLKTQKKVKRLDCKFCGQVFPTRTLCGKHENDMHVRKLSGPSACSFCGKVFPRRVNCMIHEINVHKKERKYECHYCEKKFFRKYDLAEHLNTHSGIRPAVCDFPGCTKSFFRKIHLTQHKKNIHKAVEEVWPCKLCGTEFRSKYNLGLHEKIHINFRPFSCDQCSKTFRQKRCLLAHQLTHSKERPWSCNLCSATFPAKSTLNSHLKLHRNKENGVVFQCLECVPNKQFSSEESLRSHKIFHGGSKDFVCVYCDLKFFRRYDLKKHLISKHLLNVNFSCKFCEQIFKMSRNFRKVFMNHSETYHKEISPEVIQEFLNGVYKAKMDELSQEFPQAFQERTRVCDVCHLNFVTIQQKEDHVRTAHKDEVGN